jgi:hypothetical protein
MIILKSYNSFVVQQKLLHTTGKVGGNFRRQIKCNGPFFYTNIFVALLFFTEYRLQEQRTITPVKFNTLRTRINLN